MIFRFFKLQLVNNRNKNDSPPQYTVFLKIGSHLKKGGNVTENITSKGAIL